MGKRSPPNPEIIKSLAKILAADPDVLFRLSSSTDPDITNFLKSKPKIMELVRMVMENELSDNQLDLILDFTQEIISP